MLAKIRRKIEELWSSFDLVPEYFQAVREKRWDILWGASVPSVIFVLWWIFGNLSAGAILAYLVIVLSVAGYYVWRGDHIQLIPQVAIARVNVTPTPTSGPESIVVIHVIPECLTKTPVQECSGHLLRVLKRSSHEQQWEATVIDEPSNLTWSIHDDTIPRTLYPGVLTRLNLCAIGEAGHLRLMADRIPLRWGFVFNSTDTFRFDVRVTAVNCPPADASVTVQMGKHWNEPIVGVLA